ncbi:hypothetical protein MMC11_000896 [Xylographa trunciseda]|nr:hypothetical protein [Xylographa trunciseda]
MPAGGVVMTPCSATTWGCGLNCEANTFPVAIGTLQITEANYAELGINNVTTPQAPSVSMPTSALAAATMPVATTPTNAVATACAVIFPPPTNASVVGIGVGVPLGLAFAITALLFLNERKKLIKIRRARTLIPNGGAAKVLHQAPDPEKRQYLQSYPSQLPYQQSYQPSYREPRSASTFQEAGGSPVAKEIYGGEEEMSQELP